MTTMIYPSEISSKILGIRKKIGILEGITGAQARKNKQDIFLDINPKDVDDIIKAMTPETLMQEQMKLLEIHDITNHCLPIKEIQVMASMGIFNSNLAS